MKREDQRKLDMKLKGKCPYKDWYQDGNNRSGMMSCRRKVIERN
jgi:hypothetical protein